MSPPSLFKHSRIALAICQVIALPVAQATTLLVTSRADDNIFTDDGWCTLREAIDKLNDPSLSFPDCGGTGSGPIDTINIDEALSGKAITLSVGLGQLEITSDVTVNGPSNGPLAIRVADSGHSRIFNIKDADVELNNLTLTGGRPTANGGGINVVNSSSLMLIDSIVSENTATLSGGGIYVGSTSHVTLLRSTVSGNVAPHNGGGIFVFGSVSDHGRLTLTNSTVSNNSAQNEMGGGIYAYSSTVSLESSTLSGNTAVSWGGGVFANKTEVVINNSTVSDNSTYFSGAGLYLKNTTTTLTNSTISGNSATNYGSAVYTNNSNTILRNSTIFNNTATTSSDTVFYIAFGSSARLLNTIMANGTAPDCFVSSDSLFTDVGGNLVQNDANDCSIFSIEGQNPKLGPLQDNDGDTFTHALLSGSPAINAGLSPGNCQISDQRGEPRDDAQCDIGAYEYKDTGGFFIIPAGNGKMAIFSL